jgi:hypothetical protein
LTLPLLGDLEPTKYKYQAGDRVLVTVARDTTPQQRDNIKKTLDKFCGVEVNSLIINTTRFRVVRQRVGYPDVELFEPTVDPAANTPNVANIKLTKVEFESNHRLVVTPPCFLDPPQRKSVEEYFKKWAGPSVEVIIGPPNWESSQDHRTRPGH